VNRVEQLGDEARALIEATRDAYEPTASNRAQVRWGVDRRLSLESPVRGTRYRRRVVALAAAAAVVVAGVGAAAAFAWRATVTPAERVEPTVPTKVARPLAPRAPVREESSARAAIPDRPRATSPVARRAKRARRRQGDLSAETTLIARAQAATNRGDSGEALKLLEQYDRQFAHGALVEERAAARVFALCSSGQREAARAEVARFLARWPRSPQVARVRGACRGAEDP
jgi:hypothetical protein